MGSATGLSLRSHQLITAPSNGGSFKRGPGWRFSVSDECQKPHPVTFSERTNHVQVWSQAPELIGSRPWVHVLFLLCRLQEETNTSVNDLFMLGKSIYRSLRIVSGRLWKIYASMRLDQPL